MTSGGTNCGKIKGRTAVGWYILPRLKVALVRKSDAKVVGHAMIVSKTP